ncbi:hypothetical protein GCL60_09920 [Silvanigrella paludirubra]|uniref:Uncharacterized protein n=1 Tax=Silvanigrella paludirubra TaxID=2499159 RepID=A0A6N6VXE4_9BACT|nr:hypothetical protein [Silvanigrella paludirubra]KAB8039163.1 hypothetical protein GCL60_09920 [Silvanigrella paludirubra]
MNNRKCLIDTIFYTSLIALFFISLFVFAAWQNKKNYHVEHKFLHCLRGEYSSSENSDIDFVCKKFELVHYKFVRVHESEKKLISDINEHCIKFEDNGRCRVALIDTTAKQYTAMIEGKTLVKTDVLGNLR